MSAAVFSCAFLVGTAFAANDYTEYYWTGAAAAGTDTTNLYAKGNWALADGTTATLAPSKTEMLIFTNDAPVVLSDVDTAFSCYGMRFYGADVDLPTAGSKKNVQIGLGGVKACGTGTTYRPIYQMQSQNPTAEDEVIYDIDEGQTFAIRYMFQTGIGYSVKRGKGTLQIPRYRGQKMVLEEGVLHCSGGSWNTNDKQHDFTLRGGADKVLFIDAPYIDRVTKRFQMDGGSFTIEDSAADADFELRGKTEYTLWFDGDQPDSQINARLTDADENNRTLQFMPDTAGRTLTWIKANLDSAYWGILATNGVVKFADGVQITKLRSLTAQQDGKIVFDCATAGADLSGAPWDVQGSGTFSVKGRKLFKVTGVTVDGTAVTDGIYTTASWLASDNEATIIVGTPAEPATVAATWVGGADGNSILSADNWQGGVAPDLSSFATVATFPDGGTVVVPEGATACLKGVATLGALTVSGAGTLWTGSAGLTASGTGALSFGCTVNVSANQTWSVGGHALTFAVESHIQAPRGVTWTISHSGSVVNVYSTNEQLFGVSFSSSNNSINLYADNALGGRFSKVTMSKSVLAPQGGCTLDADFQWGDVNWDKSVLYVYGGNCETVFNGFVDLYSPNDTRITAEKTTHAIRFKGGFNNIRGSNANNYVRMSPNVRNVHFDAPATISEMIMLGANSVWFNVAGNKNTRGFYMQHKAVVHTMVPDAFVEGAGATQTPGFIFVDPGTWNLHGCDQYVEVLCGATNATGEAVVTSDGDALVKLHARTMHYESGKGSLSNFACEHFGQTVDGVSYQGGAGIEKSGPIDHYMMGTSTSTGRVSVTEGRLVFTRAATDDTDVIVVPGSVVADVNVLRKPASWQTASSVSVSGTGTLVLEHDKVFGKDVNVSIDTSAGAKIELPSGTQMRCAALTVDGKPVRGTYSGAGVTGGSIFAGPSGLIVIFR